MDHEPDVVAVRSLPLGIQGHRLAGANDQADVRVNVTLDLSSGTTLELKIPFVNRNGVICKAPLSVVFGADGKLVSLATGPPVYEVNWMNDDDDDDSTKNEVKSEPDEDDFKMEVNDVKTEADHDDNDDAPVFTHEMVILDD